MIEKPEYFRYGANEWFFIYDENAYLQEHPAIILKKKDEEHYTHILCTSSFFNTFSDNPLVLSKIKKLSFNNRKFDKRFFKILDDAYFSIFYDFPEKNEVIGHFHDSKNQIIYEEGLIKKILHSKKMPAKIISNSSVKFNKNYLENFEKVEIGDALLSIDEVSEYFRGDDAWVYIKEILNEYNHPCVITTYGTLRFQEQELNDEEKIMESDINKIWREFGSQYSLGSIIQFYMKIGYSLSGFCDVFNSHFYDFEEGTGQEIIKSPKEIRKMIK